MTIREFKEKCDKWLNPHGYTTSTHSEQFIIHYTKGQASFNSPTIICKYDMERDTISVTVKSGNLKLFGKLVWEATFGSPDIKRYIKVATHYAKWCKLSHPQDF